MFDVKYTVLEEIKFGDPNKPGTYLRLCENTKKKRVIQVWSSLSNQWNVMYRENVEEAWSSWKKMFEKKY